MTEQEVIHTDKPKKIGRPKKEIKGERLWIPAECVQFVKSYLEHTSHKSKETASNQ